MGYDITQLRFPIFNATRWFSQLQCVVVLTNNLVELIIFLGRATCKRNSKQPWPTGAAALEELRNVQAAAKLNLLRDIMLPLDVLSKKFQHTSYLLPHHVRKATQQVAVELQTDFIEAELLSGQHYDNFKVNQGKVSNAIHYRDGDGKFTEKVVLRGELNEQDLADFVASMVQSIVSGLEDRFPEGDLLDNSAIFDVASYRGKSAKEIAEYGEDEFMMILKHFSQPADKHRWFDTESVGYEQRFIALQHEFKKMKRWLADYAVAPGLSNQDVWACIMKEHRLELPHMLPFAEAMFCVPVKTACVERGFNEHRVIKHRLTNRLRVVTVDSLMRVSILAGSVESFDYATAKEFHSRPVGELLVNKLFAAMSKEPANQVPSFDDGLEDDGFDEEGSVCSSSDESECWGDAEMVGVQRKELDFLAKEAEKPVEQLSNVSQLLRNLHAK